VKWRLSSRANVAESDCGRYEIRRSNDRTRGDFYNAWYLPANKHIEASHQKKVVREGCEQHAARIAVEVAA
jgi:hypothetical protein